MGAASHIGRVGGLAVALGVGTAIATGHGVASAETTDSPPPPSTNASTTDPSTTGTPAVDTTTASEAPQSESTTTGTTTATTVASGQVSAQTNTGASGTPETTETPDEPEVVEEEPTTETADPEPSASAEPTETEEPAEAPEVPEVPEVSGDEPATVETPKANNNTTAARSAAEHTSSPPANTVASLPDPASLVQKADNVAMFADARALASAGPINVSPMMAAHTAQTQITAATTTAPAPAAAPDLLTAAVNVVSSVVNWVLNPLAGAAPTTPAQPPLIWGLLAFARREFENFFNALSGRSASSTALVAPQTTTSLALAAAVPPVNPRPGFPIPGQQLSPSTNFVDWVTGNYQPNETQYWYGVTGTDVGVIWDNGMVDDPATEFNEHQVLMAFGDTFGIRGYPGDHWRPNILFRSADATLADGISLTDPEWFTGNDFGGSPLTYVPLGAPYQYHARQIIFPEGLPAGVTLIPTAGISVPTPGTEYGVTQYISFMSVTQWGAPGQWTTNYSAIAYSEDNGEVWKVAPQTVRYNQPWSGNQNFQQSAFVRPGDGYVYVYGTPNGRQGAAHLARVAERDILDLTKYEYFSAGSPGGWFGWGATPAGWHRNNPAAATAVFGVDTGACGIANPGNQVSEMSVQYNKSLNKYVVLYGDQFNNIVMRTSDTPQGGWSSAKVLMGQQSGGIYAPMMHPWSPSTLDTGSDLYWNLSLWSEYNVMLMRTDLTKV
jgi:hypothetical protein